MAAGSSEARFAIGELVHHRLFGYRGVVVDVDPVFSGSEEWYQQVARSRPPKDQPWYHVLPHGTKHQTYVAERNLESDATHAPIDHPGVDYYFERLENGAYVRRSNTVQ